MRLWLGFNAFRNRDASGSHKPSYDPSDYSMSRPDCAVTFFFGEHVVTTSTVLEFAGREIRF